MTMRFLSFLATAVFAVAFGCVMPDGMSDDTTTSTTTTVPEVDPLALRVATFNASLSQSNAWTNLQEFQAALMGGTNATALIAAETIQRMNPDVLVLQEFNYDDSGAALDIFHDQYLEVGQGGAAPITYEHRIQIPTNTGVPSGIDLNNNGSTTDANDAYGFGNFPGQFGFAILSKYPLDEANLRTFQLFLWQDMPQNLIPTTYYDAGQLAVFRLSSKNHIDLPVTLPDNRTVHILAAHPTPPVFDGAEDRNGRRNHDEIRLFADYISDPAPAYLVDDAGVSGGIDTAASFVIAGDMNADPIDGDSVQGAITQLLDHPRVNPALNSTMIPSSNGGTERGTSGTGNPAHLTANFSSPLRVDYVLPSADLEVTATGVFWPSTTEEFRYLVSGGNESDHRLVWVDVLVD